jgi:hypothetical protein
VTESDKRRVLFSIAAYRRHAPARVGADLLALRNRHHASRRTVSLALAEALVLLDRHGARDAWSAWRHDNDAAAAWPVRSTIHTYGENT